MKGVHSCSPDAFADTAVAGRGEARVRTIGDAKLCSTESVMASCAEIGWRTITHGPFQIRMQSDANEKPEGRMKPLVVLPTYNEAATIGEVIRAIRKAIPETSILVVDDSSPDGTGSFVEQFCRGDDSVFLLTRPSKTGLGSAYKAGFQWGIARGYDVLVEMDSDLSHDPAAIVALVHEIEMGADLAIGSRYVSGGRTSDWAPWRRVLSRMGNRYSQALLGIDVQDSTSGFRAYRATFIHAIDLSHVRASSYCFQIEMTYLAWQWGSTISEVPIHFTERACGSSKMSGSTIIEALRLVTLWGIQRMCRKGEGAGRSVHRVSIVEMRTCSEVVIHRACPDSRGSAASLQGSDLEQGSDLDDVCKN